MSDTTNTTGTTDALEIITAVYSFTGERYGGGYRGGRAEAMPPQHVAALERFVREVTPADLVTWFGLGEGDGVNTMIYLGETQYELSLAPRHPDRETETTETE